jgi:transposase
MTRKHYTKEFKENAVRLVEDMGMSISEAAKSLGVSHGAITKWIQAAKREGSDAFRGNGNRSAAEQEIYELKQRIKVLEEEKAILKKASAYFAKHLA